MVSLSLQFSVDHNLVIIFLLHFFSFSSSPSSSAFSSSSSSTSTSLVQAVDHPYLIGICLGGKCVDDVEGHKCVCLPGFKGRLCELTDSACQHLPCANGGECVDRANRVECRCPPGWTGQTCRQNVNECAPTSRPGEAPACKNGAACRDRPGSYECLCTEGWEGYDCSISTLSSLGNATTIPLPTATTTDKMTAPCDVDDAVSSRCHGKQFPRKRV